MKNLISFIVGCVFILTGCEDIFEKDLTGQPVVLLAPGDSVTMCEPRQLFVWEGVEGATAYRLLVVTPDFRQLQSCLLDTLTPELRYAMELPSGIYTWGIRAENSAWAGVFTYRLLIVSP